MSAKRYSGDVEIRIEPRVWRGKVWYVASIAAPYQRSRAILSLREAGVRTGEDPRDPESYDKAAEAFLQLARKHEPDIPVEAGKGSEISVRRVFRSPCPVSSEGGYGYEVPSHRPTEMRKRRRRGSKGR